MERQVIIATPSTLISLLRTVGYAWKQAALADNARTVFELGRELYDRLSARWAATSTSWAARSARWCRDYNTAVGSLESRGAVQRAQAQGAQVRRPGAGDTRRCSRRVHAPWRPPSWSTSAEHDARLHVLPATDLALALELEIDERYGVDAGGRDPSAGSLGA